MRRFIRLAAAAVMNQGVGLVADRGAGRASDAFPLGTSAPQRVTSGRAAADHRIGKGR